MKNLSRNVLILTLILMALSIGIPAFAAEGAGPSSIPGSAFDDEWDDDVWKDWGAQPSTKGGAPDSGLRDDNSSGLPKDPVGTNAGLGSFGGDSGGFGETKDKVRFNLVRDSQSDGPKGVRKYRPTYGRKTL